MVLQSLKCTHAPPCPGTVWWRHHGFIFVPKHHMPATSLQFAGAWARWWVGQGGVHPCPAHWPHLKHRKVFCMLKGTHGRLSGAPPLSIMASGSVLRKAVCDKRLAKPVGGRSLQQPEMHPETVGVSYCVRCPIHGVCTSVAGHPPSFFLSFRWTVLGFLPCGQRKGHYQDTEAGEWGLQHRGRRCV